MSVVPETAAPNSPALGEIPRGVHADRRPDAAGDQVEADADALAGQQGEPGEQAGMGLASAARRTCSAASAIAGQMPSAATASGR